MFRLYGYTVAGNMGITHITHTPILPASALPILPTQDDVSNIQFYAASIGVEPKLLLTKHAAARPE